MKTAGDERHQGSPEVIRQRVLAAVRTEFGLPALEFDSEGDLPVRFNSAVVYVRFPEGEQHIVVFSPVLTHVQRSMRLLDYMNDVNAGARFARLCFVDDSVIAAVEVFTVPFVVEHALNACRQIGTLADKLGSFLQEEFGGQTAFGDCQRVATRNAGGGGETLPKHMPPFKPHDRIRLVSQESPDFDGRAQPVGMTGVVMEVAQGYDSSWQARVLWDSGRLQDLFCPPDEVEVITVAPEEQRTVASADAGATASQDSSMKEE